MNKASDKGSGEVSAPDNEHSPSSAGMPIKRGLPSWTGSIIFHITVIVLLALLAYSNTFNVPFLFDDSVYIEENPTIKDSPYLFHLLDSDILRLDEIVETTRITRYMGYLTFFLNHKLHGLRVTGYHVINLLIHILNSFLVYFLLIITFKTPFLRKSSLIDYSKYIALFTALFFVTHPIQTQAVTYICQRFSSLVAFFYLLSVSAYIKSRITKSKTQKNALYALSFISAVLAMMTKENAFTLPLVILLYELIFLEGPRRRRFLNLFPLLITVLIIPLSIIDLDKTIGELLTGATRTPINISRHDYFITQFRVIVTYLRLLVIPVSQNLDYDYPVFHSFFNPQVVLSSVFLLSLLCLSLHLYRRSCKSDVSLRLIVFGGLWFFITLSVESSIIILADVIFEHRVYLPSVGIFSAIITGAFLYLRKLGNTWIRLVASSLCILMLIVLSYATYARNTIWNSDISLWEDVVRKSPEKYRGHNNLGIAYKSRGLLDKAIEHYTIALRLNPNLAETHNNLGNAYKDMGLTNKAIEHYMTALRLKPDLPEAHINLGNAYRGMGSFDKAIEHYKITLRLDPNHAIAHNNLGITYGSIGSFDNAIEHLQTALRLKPDLAVAHYYLGLAFLEKGLIDKARREFEAAIKKDPNFNDALQYLNR